ncbi:MAG: ribokinase [Eubacteriales bacterium]|nr:ribokinase [Eubacteriales bacterium]
MNPKIIIAGSYNGVIVAKGPVIPGVGETYLGDTFFTGPGGKGANQAVAASLQGADVSFLCKLGKDSYGDDAVKLLKQYGGLEGESIRRVDDAHTGVALIFVDGAGNNSIMVVPGANLTLTAEEIVSEVKTTKNVFMVGFQLECDVGQMCEAMIRLHAEGVKTLLDPAPAAALPMEVYPAIDIIKPNEHEAEILTGVHITTPEEAYRAGDILIGRGVKTAIITLGAKGTVIVTADEKAFVPARIVDAKDTTGAGDVFSGSFLAALSKGYPLKEAVQYANCAASISVQRLGVFEAAPAEEETLALYHSSRC